jgi:hypothetical protein
VAGFALHNGTEGFGIVGAAGQSPITPRTALLLGLTGGAPTCIGTVLSGFAVSPYLSLVWYALAAGSLLYVVFALVAMTSTSSRKIHMAYGVWTGYRTHGNDGHVFDLSRRTSLLILRSVPDNFQAITRRPDALLHRPLDMFF